MSGKKVTAQPGIDVRHRKACGQREGGKCTCSPSYRAHVYDSGTKQRIRHTFATRSAAKLWRQDALVALRTGKLAEQRSKTMVRAACDAWMVEARAGIVRTRGGDELKRGTLRAYDQALRLRIYPAMAEMPFYRVRRVHVQDLVDGLVASDVAPATINTTVGALGAIYARAVQRDEIEISPTIGVKVPAARNGRTRFATAQEAAALLGLVPEEDRSIWATATYAGLRRGEVGALRWTDVDLKAGTIKVDRSWDPTDGMGDTKSRNRRVVPIAAVLREHLASERLRQSPGMELCFASGSDHPFDARRLQERADAAWKAGGMDRLTPHDCRHSFASLMIAANVNAKALSVFMGHSSVAITLDRYGHLMPGSEAEAAELLNTYLKANA